MGDIILTSPVVRNVKNQLDSEIHFLVKKTFLDLVDHSPHISKTHSLNPDIKHSISALQNESFDLVIDLQKNRKSKAIVKSLGCESLSFDKLNVKKWLLVQSGIDLLPDIHIVDRYFKSLEPIQIVNDNLGNELFISPNTTNSVQELNLPAEFIAIGMGAQHKGKCLNQEQLSFIIEEATLPIVLLGGKRELELSRSIEKNSSKKIWNLTGKSSLLETAEIIRNSKITLSGDTGIMHMASAYKVPQISVWGCTSPKLGMFPYEAHEDSIILEPIDHEKRPCAKLGNRCKYAPNWCIQSIDPNRIVMALDLILKK